MSPADAPSPTGHEVGKTSWKDTARHWVGRLSVSWLPHSFIAKFIDDYYIDQEPGTFFKQAVRDELTRRHYNRTDAEIRADNRNLFWGATAGVRWHEARRRKYQDRRFYEEYLQACGRTLEQIHWLLDQFPFINNVCEIGTGHGLMLDYLSGQFTRIERFQGIDLSAELIARNHAIYAGSKVEFLRVEAADYVVRHCRPGTLFVAFGAFECFTQAELEEFLALTRTVDRVAVASCDAVDIDYDAALERDSRPRGNLLYNHNYRHLLEKHGYEICFDHLEHAKPFYNRLSILAAGFPCGAVKAHTRTSH